MSDISLADDVASAFRDVASLQSDTNWCICGFGSGDKAAEKTVQVISSGAGGYAEFISNLDDSKPYFCGLRVCPVDRATNVESTRSKLIFITWVGSGVSPLKRGRISVQRAVVQAVVNGVTCNIDATDKGDLEKEVIAKKLLQSGGAHLPSHFVFGPDDELEVSKLAHEE